MKIIDITGQKFNKLTAVKVHHKAKYGHYFWEFLCDCGKIKIAATNHVKSGRIGSCGCIGKNFKPTHGMSKTPFNGIYWAAKNRCENTKAISYKNYGGRGIKFLWDSFDHFRDDMYDSYIRHIDKFGSKQTSIERVDNNGDYCLDNCTWATRKQQCANRRPRTKKSK